MSFINQICRQRINKEFPNEIEHYMFHLLRKVKHIPKEILNDIIFVKNLQDTLRFEVYEKKIIGIIKEEEIISNGEIIRSGYGIPQSLMDTNINIPSKKSIIKIVNNEVNGNSLG